MYLYSIHKIIVLLYYLYYLINVFFNINGKYFVNFFTFIN